MSKKRNVTVVSPTKTASQLAEYWSPQVLAELDDNYVKVAKLNGTFTWHSHDNEDELFFILKGRLQIEYETETVTLEEGDLHVVPRGARHLPIAENECLVMLIERKTTLHTGSDQTEKTRNIEEQLGDFKASR
jgi:mannose-6-phosphate isomerase-like protein (cupin superfamily)